MYKIFEATAVLNAINCFLVDKESVSFADRLWRDIVILRFQVFCSNFNVMKPKIWKMA